MIRYWIVTPRSSGIVAFENANAGAAMVEGETTSWFRIAFRHMNREKALTHWLQKGYQVVHEDSWKGLEILKPLQWDYVSRKGTEHGLPNDSYPRR